MAARFVAEYLKTYGYRDESPIELVKLRAVGRGLREQRLDFEHMRDRGPRRRAEPARSRRISFARGAAAIDTEVVPRSARSAVAPAADRWSSRSSTPPSSCRRTPPCYRDAIGNIVLDLECAHEGRSHHLRRHQERARLDRRRHGLHGGAHRPLGDRQGRDGFLGRAVRRATGRWWRRPRPSPSTSAPSPRPWRRCSRSSATTSHDGDAVIMNDPYHGGMHLPDIFMFMPLFFEGKRRAFAVVICHHTDVGGRVPGSNASRLHRDLPGRPAHPAAEALRPRRAQRDAGGADQDQRARAGPRLGRPLRAVRRRAGRQARPRQAVRSATAPTRSRPT